jgi:hypothetical protein
MNIIFKMLKYLKNYSNLITGAISIALVIILVIQSISLSNYKSLYQVNAETISTIQGELESAEKQNEELKAQISGQEQLIVDKDTQIKKLEQENKILKETATTILFDAEPETTTTASNGSSKTESTKPSTNKQPSTTKSETSTTRAETTTAKPSGTYAQATQVWNGLRNLGLNKYVCAGILGNIMAEVGGQTLDISRWPQYSQGTYYGICQWAGSRKQRLLNNFGPTLEDQIRFLSVELFEVIPKGNSFYNMQDEKEAALYFAKYYERCGSGSYSVRQSNATKALNYFT